ncbi:hypothetical protein C0J52_03441 [Blattella germanica]|nr:hypothetical protein C0J52_03441 [Blattella germanica]
MEDGILQQLNIEFRNLCYSVRTKKAKEEKTILRGINGQFRCGSLTAILGPSGAGKTSLLNIISGFKSNGVAGSVRVNGKERHLEEFRKLSCYITQEFTMFPQLTTRETIMFAADFKLGSGVSTQEKRQLASEQDSRTCGSHESRKDFSWRSLCSSSLQVISHLKSLARGGRTVVCTIHQPSSRLFEMFDDLYILSEGQCLYNGPINAMTSVFEEAGFQCPEHYNRADFALEIASRKKDENVENLVAKYSSGAQFIPSEIYKDCRNDVPLEAVIVGREHLNSWYTITSYYFSKLVAELPVQLGVYLVGALQNPMVLLSGFLVRLRDIPSYLEWFTTLSYYRYGFQAAMQSIYGFDRANLKCSQPYCRFKSPKDILEEFDIKSDTYETDIMYLTIWIFVFQIILYIVLMWKLRTSN